MLSSKGQNLQEQIKMNNDLGKKRHMLKTNFVLHNSSKLNMVVKKEVSPRPVCQPEAILQPVITPVKQPREMAACSPILQTSQKFVSRLNFES
jgi:hypothetical protein